MNPGVRDAISLSSTFGSSATPRAWTRRISSRPRQVGTVDDDLPVEAPGTDERRVEHVRTVRRSHDDDALAGVEPVHLDQQLVQGLLALVVGAEPGAHRAAATLADGVDLIQEDERGCLLLRLLEQLAHARSSEADEHLHELRARHEEERHVRLSGDRARQQGLAAPGGSEQEDALRDPAAQALILLGVLQEIDDLAELFLGLVDPRDVVEVGLHLLAVVDADLVAAHVQRRAGAAGSHPPEDEVIDDDHHQQERQDVQQQRGEDAGADGLDVHAGGHQLVGQWARVEVGRKRRDEVDLLATPQHRARYARIGDLDRDVGHDVALVDGIHELRVRDLLGVRVREPAVEDQEADQQEGDHQPWAEAGPGHAGATGPIR